MSKINALINMIISYIIYPFKKSEFKYCNKLEYDYIDYKIDKKYIFIEDDLSSIFDFNIVYNWLTSFNYLDKKRYCEISQYLFFIN